MPFSFVFICHWTCFFACFSSTRDSVETLLFSASLFFLVELEFMVTFPSSVPRRNSALIQTSVNIMFWGDNSQAFLIVTHGMPFLLFLEIGITDRRISLHKELPTRHTLKGNVRERTKSETTLQWSCDFKFLCQCDS